MKKFVSAAVITAMIASMGVGAMADVSFGSGASSDVAWPTNFGFGDKLTVIGANSNVKEYVAGEKISLLPGDVIYMPLTHSVAVTETPEEEVEDTTPEVEENNGENSEEPVVAVLAAAAEGELTSAPYTGKVDKDWRIKFTAREFVENATFYTATANDSVLNNGALYIKVEMDDQLDSVDSETLNYGVYINENGTANKTERVTVNANFANVDGGEIEFDFINFVSEPSVWTVKEEGSGKARFDFNGEATFEVTMYNGEKVLLDLGRDFVKSIAIANEEADLEFYNFRSSYDSFVRKGTLALNGDKDSFVYEIVDDELVEVNFKYNKDDETLEFTTDELGHYVVSDIELEAADVKPSTGGSNKPNNSGSSSDKTNPSTGAADFVGSAAALAVVSVAGAGALALGKKR